MRLNFQIRIPRGLKPACFVLVAARLKPCPDTELLTR